MSLSTVARLSCKFTSSLRPNNLSYIDGCAGYAFAHRNQVVIAESHKISEKLWRTGARSEAGSGWIADISLVLIQVRWVMMAFGPTLLLITEHGLLHMYGDDGQKLQHVYAMNGESGAGKIVAESKACKESVEIGPGLASNGVDRIYIGTGAGEIRSVQVQTSQICKSSTLVSTVHSSAAITDLQSYRHILASGDVAGNVAIWDLTINQLVASFGSFQSPVNSLAVNGDVVVAGFLSGHVRILNPSKDSIIEIAAHLRAVNAVGIDARTGTFACASEDTFVSVYSLPDADNQVRCLGCAAPTPALLTGICCSGPPSVVAVSAYDSDEIFFLKIA